LAIKTCELSSDVCKSYGFGASAKGYFLFFIFFSFGMLIFLLVLEPFAVALEGTRRRRERMEQRARRLCYAKSRKLVAAPRIQKGGYHIFLSHVWGSGQDQMRVIKQRLLEMVPDFSVFLDVDDLKDISNLGKYITRAKAVLIFCSDGYFVSKNCMIELQASVKQGKLIIPLLDPDASKGGLTQHQVHDLLIKAEESLYEKWGFDGTSLSAEALYKALFATPPIEWNRIGAFQDVTLRCIAERLLPKGHEPTYLQKEVINEKVVWQPATKIYHTYCSNNNPGALKMLQEFADNQSLVLKLAGSRLAPSRRRSSARRKHANVTNTSLHVTLDVEQLGECNSMLVYLTAETWTRAEKSRMFGEEVVRAMEAGARLLLVHEMVGVGGQEARFGCEFASFFSCDDGATPRELLNRGIYSEIAIALKGGEWRKTSMAMLAKAFAGSDAVGEEDANELKSTQAMSKAVQQELIMAGVVTATAARGRATTSSISQFLDRLLVSMSEIVSLWSSRSSFGRVSLLTRSPPPAPVDGAGVEVSAV